MTILEASRLLYKYFQEHDVFTFEQNFKDLFIVGDKIECQAAILGALQEFEKMELVKCVDSQVFNTKTDHTPKQLWVLVKPYAMINQTIIIDAETCNLIANTINQIADKESDDRIRCDPTNITSQDIRNTLLSLMLLLNRQENNNDLT